MATCKNIIDRARFDLNDDQTFTFSAINSSTFLSRIRTELNDAGTKTAISKSASDFITEIRQELNDAENTSSAAVTTDEVMALVRADVGDVESPATTSSSVVSQIRSSLGDIETVASVASDLKPDLRKILGDPEDASTATTVTVNDLLHYSISVNNTANISTFTTEGIATIKGMRSDACVSAGGSLRGAFQSALTAFVAARIVEGEIEVQADTNRWKTFYEKFLAAVNAVAYHWTDAELDSYISSAKEAIKAIRPDAANGSGFSILFQDCLLNYAAYYANIRRGQQDQAVLQKIMDDIQNVAYHWTTDELTTIETQAKSEIEGLRTDAFISSAMRTAFIGTLVSRCICKALERRMGPNVRDNQLWQSSNDKFYKDIAEIHYHFTNDELTNLVTNGINEIISLRADAKVSSSGSTTVRAEFTEALKSFCVFKALERRIGKEDGAAEKWKVNNDMFYSDIKTISYHYTNAELTNYLNMAVREIASQRPDSLLNTTIALSSIRSEFENTVKRFCIYSAVERRFGRAEEAPELWKVNHDSFWNDLQTIEFHWLDADLNTYISEAVDYVKSTRDDCVDSSGNIRIDLQPVMLYYIACRAHDRNSTKDKGAAAWKAAMDKYQMFLKELPYHWFDDDLLRLLQDSIVEIVMRRTDARMDANGDEITNLDLSPAASATYPLRQSFEKASEYYIVGQAELTRPDSKMDKAIYWINQYNSLISGRTK